LLLELKDKLPAVTISDIVPSAQAPAFVPSDTASQVCDALTGLGFSRAQAEAAVAKVKRDDSPAPVEQLLRQALATLG
jgi:Holliday junction resolvasome RuvABC DNA-binding subunit